MNIKDFVKQSILEISQGLLEAQEQGVAINPTLGNLAATRIQFSLNVESETKGGASLKVVGGEVGKTFSNRIDFAIDAMLISKPLSYSKPERPVYEDKDSSK